MTYEAIELTKYDQQLAKEIPCDYHLHKHDVTKQNKNKNKIHMYTKKIKVFLVHKALRCATHIS